jgi:biopolymer transport protein ExbD
MRVPVRQFKGQATFNITPLIDVVFLLIIFFLAASHLVRAESREAVDLPEASQSDDEETDAPNRLIVTITADRQLHVAGDAVDFAEVERLILAGGRDNQASFQVRIRADRSVPFRDVQPILLACARAGVRLIKFAVLAKSN